MEAPYVVACCNMHKYKDHYIKTVHLFHFAARPSAVDFTK